MAVIDQVHGEPPIRVVQSALEAPAKHNFERDNYSSNNSSDMSIPEEIEESCQLLTNSQEQVSSTEFNGKVTTGARASNVPLSYSQSIQTSLPDNRSSINNQFRLSTLNQPSGSPQKPPTPKVGYAVL